MLTRAVCAHRKPTKQQISKRMMGICHQEGLAVNEVTLEALTEASNSDIRLVLGQLQMIRLRNTRLTYDDVKVASFTFINHIATQRCSNAKAMA